MRFPLGAAGCVDAAALLSGRVSYANVETQRKGRAVVDLGHVEPSRLASCRADYAIFTHAAVYRADPRFPEQRAIYRRIAAGGRLRAVITPQPGSRGGPVVHIVELARSP